jgi:hypothetical protein
MASDGARRMMHDTGYNVSQNLYGDQTLTGYTSPNAQHSFFADGSMHESPARRNVQQGFSVGGQSYDGQGSYDAEQSYFGNDSAQSSSTKPAFQQDYYVDDQGQLSPNAQQGYSSPNAQHMAYQTMASPERQPTLYDNVAHPSASGSQQQSFYGAGQGQGDTSAYLLQQGFNMGESGPGNGDGDGKGDGDGDGDVNMGNGF